MVAYQEVPAGKLLRHNLLVYGVGGILVPFAAIKLIDCIVAPLLGCWKGGSYVLQRLRFAPGMSQTGMVPHLQRAGDLLGESGAGRLPYITLPALLLLLGSGTVAALTAAAMVLVYPLTVIAALL